MVRRLVQEEEVRVDQEELGQGDPHPPAAGERLHAAREVGLPEGEAGENALGLVLDHVSAHPLEVVHELAVLVGEALGFFGEAPRPCRLPGLSAGARCS